MCNNERLVVLIDMDCFYVQVEQRRDPSVRGKPCAVVQYNKWKGGGIIAVSYEARAVGVTRQMRGDDAKQKCPEINLLMVPTANGKADLTRYRDAGAEVIEVLLQFDGTVERASIDEAYIDLTNVVNKKFHTRSCEYLPNSNELENTHVVSFPKQLDSSDLDKRLVGLKEYFSSIKDDSNVARLCYAASIVEEMREAIWQQTSFRCSAGISHNKMLAKLACGINKPNKQTILPFTGVPELFSRTKIGKIRNLGGKLGASLSTTFKIDFIGEVAKIPTQQLNDKFGAKTGLWLSELCRGIDHEPIKERHVAQSVGCSKNFTGSDALNTRPKLKHWLGCLITELVERLAKDKLKNNRVAHGLTLHVSHHSHGSWKAISRSCRIEKYEVDHAIASCMATLETLNEAGHNSETWSPAITMLGISSKNFKEVSDGEGKQNVAKLLATQSSKSPKKSEAVSVKVDRPTTKQPKRDFIDFFARNTTPGKKDKTESHQKSSDSRAVYKNQDIKSKIDKETSFPLKNAHFNRNTSAVSTLRAKSSFFSQLKKTNTINNKSTNTRKDYPQSQYNAENLLIKSIESQTNVEPEVIDVEKATQSTKPSESMNLQYDTSTSGIKSSNFPYNMSDIDKEVFDSLPLSLQKEIQSTAQDSQNSQDRRETVLNRKRPSNSPDTQNSISKFLRATSASFSSISDKVGSGHSSHETRKKPRTKIKKNAHTVFDVTSVPLGFFRARSQASAAIHSALKATKSDSSVHQKVTGHTKSSTSHTSSLWSSMSAAGPRYKCDECECMVSISEVSSHSEFHEKQNREKA